MTEQGSSSLQQISDEQQRSERVAKQVQRSKFMGLGENPPKLASESQHSLLTTNWSTFSDKNSDYLNDNSLPPQIYTLIEKYRGKARTVKPGNDLALLIDDFFGEANAVLKDSQLREIARMRNENQIEITKLKRVIDGKNKENSQKSHVNSQMFVDNEEVLERRHLIAKLEHANSRLRACENLLAAGSQDKVKFMEGAQWICKKVTNVCASHNSRVQSLYKEYELRETDDQANEWLLKEISD